MILGRNLKVIIDGVQVAGAKSCEFDISQEFITACSPTNGRVLIKIPTTYDWSISVSCLLPSSAAAKGFVNKVRQGTKCEVRFMDTSLQRYKGDVYVKSVKQSGPIGGIATYSVQFESRGELQDY